MKVPTLRPLVLLMRVLLRLSWVRSIAGNIDKRQSNYVERLTDSQTDRQAPVAVPQCSHRRHMVWPLSTSFLKVSSYLPENTHCTHYENQSVDVFCEGYRCISEYQTKYRLQTVVYVAADGKYIYHWALNGCFLMSCLLWLPVGDDTWCVRPAGPHFFTLCFCVLVWWPPDSLSCWKRNFLNLMERKFCGWPPVGLQCAVTTTDVRHLAAVGAGTGQMAAPTVGERYIASLNRPD
jgi:hypothetical protein